ncbi:MAG: hypothetical protein BM563_07020 [Bacteroidetes bacterium MedPE-SWsnd-G1]|nr:MAG: hypothetical protein BM563_07020 [Bacteroidetes bacterium MedPE-SWsnd-G1]
MKKLLAIILLCCFSTITFHGQEKSLFSQEEVIYSRKHGMALTMIVLKPEKANKKGIIQVVSGSWYSGYSQLENEISNAEPFLENGYTVFVTIHSSNPRFDISEAALDIKHAVQYVRFNSEKFNIDPNNIGITGSSAGGHLSLVANTSSDIKNLNSKNPLKRVSSKVQAVAVFYPPTDFLNWGQPNAYMNYLEHSPILAQSYVLGAMTYHEFDSINIVYKPIVNPKLLKEVITKVSPAQLVSIDDAPTYIIHGDKDQVVPLQQSQHLQKKFDSIGVPLILKIKPGADHGWQNMNEDRQEFVNWFDKYLIEE